MKIHGDLMQGTYGWLEARGGIFDRAVCTVDMPPATHYHGRNLFDGCATYTKHRYVQEVAR